MGHSSLKIYMIHKHNFVLVKDEVSAVAGQSHVVNPRFRTGKTYACIHIGCGETREVYENGDITIIRKGFSEEDALDDDTFLD